MLMDQEHAQSFPELPALSDVGAVVLVAWMVAAVLVARRRTRTREQSGRKRTHDCCRRTAKLSRIALG
jgi:hypothetical protein